MISANVIGEMRACGTGHLHGSPSKGRFNGTMTQIIGEVGTLFEERVTSGVCTARVLMRHLFFTVAYDCETFHRGGGVTVLRGLPINREGERDAQPSRP
jgi:hypothetical protein